MNPEYNFKIAPTGKISVLFLERNIYDFVQAAEFVKQIPYGRNVNKKDVSTVFADHQGTCSTKHALLKALCIENKRDDIKLILCLFKMNRRNTPSITSLLEEHNLDHIPEAHNYLKIGNIILDSTFPTSTLKLTDDDVLEESEITPAQITDFKVNYHKAYLQKWLKEQSSLNMSFDELWRIREACITAFSRRQ